MAVYYNEADPAACAWLCHTAYLMKPPVTVQLALASDMPRGALRLLVSPAPPA